MEINKKEKEILGGVISVVILVGLVWFFSSQEVKVVDFGSSGNQSKQESVVQTDQDQVMAVFPDNLPVETNVQVRESYVYTPANSTNQQSTLEYVSERTFQENSDAFAGFLENSDFQIINQINEEDFAFFYARGPESDLSISIDSATGETDVVISLLQRDE